MQHVCFWNNEILKPVQKYGASIEGSHGHTAFNKLKVLLDRMMLRRTKLERADDLGLPPRAVQVRRDYLYVHTLLCGANSAIKLGSLFFFTLSVFKVRKKKRNCTPVYIPMSNASFRHLQTPEQCKSWSRVLPLRHSFRLTIGVFNP